MVFSSDFFFLFLALIENDSLISEQMNSVLNSLFKLFLIIKFSFFKKELFTFSSKFIELSSLLFILLSLNILVNFPLLLFSLWKKSFNLSFLLFNSFILIIFSSFFCRISFRI